jgi:hypothetical protein
MTNIYQIPKEEVEKIEWQDDYKDYDYNLFKLGEGHKEFIIINPAFENYKITSIPYDGNRCIVWKYKDQWVAKYFNALWDIEKRYAEIEIEIEFEIEWIRNPEINLNIFFENKPTINSIKDLYDLNYEMIWYVDPKFTKNNVWAYKGKLKDYKVLGTKDMGYVSITKSDQLIEWIRNPEIDNKIIFENDPTVNSSYDLYDLNYEMIWYIDPELTKNNIWAFKGKLKDYKVLGTKDMGYVSIAKSDQLDVIFISYNEPDAEKNWLRVLEKSPKAFRINGIKGIVNAHKCAAELATTDMFYVVDGDAYLTDEWSFEYQPSIFDRDCVHVWRSRNPVNGLEYGYGGVKLLPKQLTLDVDPSCVDMTTSISNKFKPMATISNITAFNTDEFNTFRSAFRECTKLSSNILKRQLARESSKRLDIWCTVGAESPFGEWAIKGAVAGREFGIKNIGNRDQLSLINNNDWLKEEFLKQ